MSIAVAPPAITPASTGKAAWALIRVKIRMFWNHLRSWKWFWSTPLFLLLFIGWGALLGSGMADFLPMARGIASSLVDSLVAMILLYAVLLVVTSDLMMGHTLNWGQMSSDHGYLATLPLSPVALLAGKLFERLVTDWFAPIFLLGGMLGVSLNKGFSWSGLGVGIILYLQVELLIGLSVILLTLALGRLLRPAAFKNFYALLGYASMLLGLGPYLWFSSNPTGAIWTILTWWPTVGPWLQIPLEPARLIVESLLAASPVAAFWHWQAIWLGAFAVGTLLFKLMADRQWLTWVHSGVAARSNGARSWLKGLMRKESQLLRNDFTLLVNSLMLPLTIIVFEIWVLKGIFSLSGLGKAMNALAAAFMYFCLFGPVNAMGSEGKAVSLVEVLPVSPSRLIAEKSFFWILIAETIFLPTAFGVGWYLGLPISQWPILVLWTGLFAAGGVWVAVSMSTIFADYDAKVPQQRSTLTGKMLASMAMGVAIPAKSGSFQSIFAGVVFLGLAAALHYKACEVFAARVDSERRLAPRFELHDAVILVLTVSAVQVIVGAAASGVLGDSHRELWPWLSAYVISMLVLSRSVFTYVRRRFSTFAAPVGFSAPSVFHLGGAFLLACGAGWMAAHYLEFLNGQGTNLFTGFKNVWDAGSDIIGGYWTAGLLFGVMCCLAPLVEEAFFRGFVDQALRTSGFTGWGGILIGAGFFAMQHPPASMPPVFVLGILCAWLFRQSGSLWPGVLAHAVYNGLVLFQHFLHIMGPLIRETMSDWHSSLLILLINR